MVANKQIPEMNSYEEIADFWDSHSLADYWHETEPAEFQIAPDARRRERNVYSSLRNQRIASHPKRS